MDEQISFIFITGVCKFSRMGVFSVLNHYKDISIDPEYGAMLGYTHEEFAANFAGHVKAAADALKMGEERFLEAAKSYYNGFCFDGQTRVYNPFSTVLMLNNKKFRNYWFDTGSSSFMTRYLRVNKLTVEEFRGLGVDEGFASEPGEIDQTGPAGFLYQYGYLTLRPGEAEGKFKLDYPNREVLTSMSILMMDCILGGRTSSVECGEELEKALGNVDVGAVVNEFNLVLSSLPYDDLVEALRKGKKIRVKDAIEERAAKDAIGEWLYRSTIKMFLLGAGLTVIAERHGNLGRCDLELQHGERAWIFELKVAAKGQSDEDAAKAALAQIIEKNYAGPHRKPILVGIAVNKAKRVITAWAAQEGLSPEKRPIKVFRKKNPEKPAPKGPCPRM